MKRRIMTIIALLGVVCAAQAKMIMPRSENRFERMLKRHKYAVVVFYQSDKMTKKNKPLQKEIDEMERVLKSLSRSRFYRDARVSFGLINVGRDKLSHIDEEYGVKEMPTVMLFKNGVPVRNNMNQAVTYKRFFNREQLDKFVRSNWQDELEERIKDIREERQRRRDVYRYYQPYFYYGYGSPYYYHRPYYYHHYPYRYYGYRHGPHVGFGFYI